MNTLDPSAVAGPRPATRAAPVPGVVYALPVPADARRALAIEPVETMTDAFNRADCAAALRLAPGQSRCFAFGAEFVPATPAGFPSDNPCAADAA